MHLVYFDESGNSGNNLTDRQQPIFVLGALLVPQNIWHKVEKACCFNYVIWRLFLQEKRKKKEQGFKSNPLTSPGLNLLNY